MQDQGAGMDELRKTVLRLHPDLKDKAPFWKRKTSVLKVRCARCACAVCAVGWVGMGG